MTQAIVLISFRGHLVSDPLPWPGNPSGSVRVPLKSFEVAEEDLRGRLDRLSAKFCPSLNCMTYGCLLHRESTSHLHHILTTLTTVLLS